MTSKWNTPAYTYPETDTDGRKYKQVELPAGNFRMYEDEYPTWHQVESGASWLDKVMHDWMVEGKSNK